MSILTGIALMLLTWTVALPLVILGLLYSCRGRKPVRAFDEHGNEIDPPRIKII